ncbi:MAG: hypothetical protein V1936_00445 [Patescibacteria group bacterium]
MFATSADILNVVLAVSIGLVALFLSIALFYAIFVLRDLSETTRALKKVASKANDILIQPAKLLAFLFTKAKTISELVEKHVAKRSSRK